MDLGLSGRAAIVTGASRGLGLAAAEALVAEGVQVLAAARSAAALADLADRSGGAVVAHACDLADREAVAGLVDAALAAFGRLDVVVSNAGIAPAAKFVEQDLDVWDQVFAVNVTAPAVLARAAGRVLLAQGSGKLIHVASTSGLRGKPLLAAYSASKGALLRLSEALASEWAGQGVQVNAIAPGAFATDAQAAVLGDEAILTRRLRKIPAGRMGAPHELGPLVCYLASPASDFVSGATFVIDGGEVAKL